MGQIAITTAHSNALIAAGKQNNPVFGWDQKATSANITLATGTVASGNIASLVTGSTYDLVTITPATGDIDINVDDTASTMNMVCIFAHDIADFSGTVEVWNDTGAGYVMIDDITPTDNSAIILRFEDSTSTAADWSIRITGLSGDVTLGGVFIGPEFVLNTREFQGTAPPRTPNRVDLQSNVSEGANLLGTSVARKGSTMELPLTLLQSDTEGGPNTTTWNAFQRHYNDGKPMAFAWRPGTFNDAWWSWREGNAMNPTYTGPRARMSANIALRLFEGLDQ